MMKTKSNYILIKKRVHPKDQLMQETIQNIQWKQKRNVLWGFNGLELQQNQYWKKFLNKPILMNS